MISDLLASRTVLFNTYFANVTHALTSPAQQLLLVSDYAVRQVSHLQHLLQEDECTFRLQRNDYQDLIEHISLNLSPVLFAKALRHFRHRHLLRLWLRELATIASTEDTLEDWSHCADVLILHALHYCEKNLQAQHGNAYSESGVLVHIHALAMGKLGGFELNFSSDIDLIFAFSAAGHTDGPVSLSNQQYFNKLIQQWMQLLQNNTEDGFVFRVDLRLRPYGESGPLVSSLAALETYYQEQGRDWERYAMVKARPIGESFKTCVWFQQLIMPFVYRRYVDFSVIESLRSMKTMIEREVQLNPMLDDIKRGQGGIREIEFVIQCMQLIRGGRQPDLQQPSIMTALQVLKKEKLLAHTDALKQAYLFLRQLENAVQIQNDQQTHVLPKEALKQTQLVIAMGQTTWDALLVQLHRYQRIVRLAFRGVLGEDNAYQDDKRMLVNQLTSLWQGHIETGMAIHLLISLEFNDAERCYHILHTFRHSARCRRLSQMARMRLDRLMVLLLIQLMEVDKTDVVLLQVINLLEHIVGRSAYLALLTENPSVLQELLYCFVHSPFISSLLVQYPFLLEVLIDQEPHWRPYSKQQLTDLLHHRVLHAVDDESYNETLRQFKLSCWLLAARAELYGHCDAIRIGRFLTEVAEVIMMAVLTRACDKLSTRFPKMQAIKFRFAMIAYGKLGSREMSYDSDLDLVFLHAVAPEEETLVTRLTQKILHMLSTRSQMGVLYQVDTRLRPSGAAGLLVSHWDNYVDYQRVHAWVWEHQALLKARVLFASPRMRPIFTALKKDILFMPRYPQSLCEDIRSMRAKIDKHKEGNAIKYAEGGLLDIEFLVQFLVLAYPHIQLVSCTNTLQQMKYLYQAHRLTLSQWTLLKKAYRRYHRLLHQQIVVPEVMEACHHEQKSVSLIIKALMPC